MAKRELHGALVSPWIAIGQERVVTVFGKVYSSVEIETITGESTPFLAEETFAALISMADDPKKEPVKIILNNRGGSMTAAMLIIDAMEHLQAKGISVQPLVIGSSLGVSTAILASGSKGYRYALKHAMIHLGPLPLPSLKDFDTVDSERIKQYNDRQKEFLHSGLAEKTRLPEYFLNKKGDENNPKIAEPEFRFKQVKDGIKADLFLSPEQAIEAGIIDQILLPGDPILDKIFHIPDRTKHPGFFPRGKSEGGAQ